MGERFLLHKYSYLLHPVSDKAQNKNCTQNIHKTNLNFAPMSFGFVTICSALELATSGEGFVSILLSLGLAIIGLVFLY